MPPVARRKLPLELIVIAAMLGKKCRPDFPDIVIHFPDID